MMSILEIYEPMAMFQVKDHSSHDKVMICGENMGIRDTTALKWNILMSTGIKWKKYVVLMAPRSTICKEKYGRLLWNLSKTPSNLFLIAKFESSDA